MTEDIEEKPILCCYDMDAHIEDKEFDRLIEYQPDTRSYSFRLYENGKYAGVWQPLYHCPWCGTELPEDLSEKYEEILEQEYGITDWGKPGWPEGMPPKEFRTNEWWKKRGL